MHHRQGMKSHFAYSCLRILFYGGYLQFGVESHTNNKVNNVKRKQNLSHCKEKSRTDRMKDRYTEGVSFLDNFGITNNLPCLAARNKKIRI